MRDSDPLVSVIVPAYNAEAWLGEALESIVGQSYERREIVVMDDASTDRTGEIARGYAPAVAYHRQSARRGQFENVNDGIARARGDLIAIHHADDIYEPAILEREVAMFAREPQLGAVFCLDILVTPTGVEYGRVALPPELPPARPLDHAAVLRTLMLRRNRFLRTPGALVRAAVYRDVGPYTTRFGSAGDLEMWLRISSRYPIAILDEHLYRYRHSEASEGQAFQYLRLVRDNFFDVMDAHLARTNTVPDPDAWAAYRAHETEDRLMVALNHYIRDDRAGARAWLRGLDARRLLASRAVQRTRLITLFALLELLARAPYLPPVAAAFWRRWHHRQWMRPEAGA